MTVTQTSAIKNAFQDHADINRPFTGMIHVLDFSGDTKIIWDSKNEDEVQSARDQFDALKKKGFIAYSVKKNGDKGEVMKKFDPDEERIIMAPAVAGG